MQALIFKFADVILHRDELVKLNVEYITWVTSGVDKALGVSMVDLVGKSIVVYVDSTIDKVCSDKPPHGVFYLVEVHGEIAGMVGLRKLTADVAEIKRLYVRPEFRGRHLGGCFIQKILQDAKQFGYQSVYLDTAPFMFSAQRLYKSFGFKLRASYAGTEIPIELHAAWVFMECDLSKVDLETL
jgi:ribosomal protein S18 acetylase RimI-like enzyme